MFEKRLTVRDFRMLCVLFLIAFFGTVTTAVAQFNYTPQNLASWSDLDAAVANAYNGFTNQTVVYPPCQTHFIVSGGYYTLSDGELAALTNYCQCSTQFNVPVWQMTVCETQLSSRAWVYVGSGGTPFRTNLCPWSYDPVQWVNAAYGQNAPSYLTTSDVANWYANRDRNRFLWNPTFVSENDWLNMQTAAWAAVSETTNSPSVTSQLPKPPADPTQLTLSSIIANSANNQTTMWIYSPSNRPVVILGCPALNATKNQWQVIGSMQAVPPYSFWETPKLDAEFLMAAYSDVDSDGDKIPDALETYVYGTNPYNADSDGDGISDYDEICLYGTNPSDSSSTPNNQPNTIAIDVFLCNWVEGWGGTMCLKTVLICFSQEKL